MSARFSSQAVSLALVLSGAPSLVACGGGTTPPPGADAGVADAGDTTDAGHDAGPPLACAADVHVLEGVMDDTVSLTFDTTMTETRPRDLGLACGNTEPALRWAPQEVVEFHVPGTGPVAVRFTTAVSGTESDFNTVVQVRRECEHVPAQLFPPSCFDDSDAMELRASGGVSAMGGDTLYFVVTGYSMPPPEEMAVDRGTVEIDFTVSGNSPPTVTDGYVRLAMNDVLIRAMGNDPDGDVVGVALNFLGPDGVLLDIYGDGTATMDGSVFRIDFSPRPTGTDYDGTARIDGTMVNAAGYLRGVGATAALIRVYDSAYATSAPYMVPIAEAMFSGYHEPCDADHLCASPMVCADDGSGGTYCDATGAARAECDAATPITIATPTDTATSANVTGTTGAGAGVYDGSCTGGGGVGAETIYVVTVPAGDFDLIASTEFPGSGMTDTIVYVRTACPDPGSEVACNDDIMYPDDTFSAVEIRDAAAGDYFVFVERYGGLASGTIPHELGVTLRPVLAPGATCDPAGVQNRCAAGACPSGGTCP